MDKKIKLRVKFYPFHHLNIHTDFELIIRRALDSDNWETILTDDSVISMANTLLKQGAIKIGHNFVKVDRELDGLLIKER